MKTKLKIGSFLFPMLFFSFLLNAQQIGVDFFYCPNTLSPTYMDDSEGMPVKIEIALNEKANLNNLNLSGTLSENTSFVGVSAFPSNFSNVISTSFRLSDGVNFRDVNLSAKRISRRNAPFTLSFTERFRPSDWVRSTTGWTSIGVEDTVSGDIELYNDNAVFFLAFNKGQELLSFDISGANLQMFDGVFSVESSITGVDDWEPLYFMDNCSQDFKSDTYRIFLKIETQTQYIRFSVVQREQRQPVLLNNFSIGAYHGEELDNHISTLTVTEKTVGLKSNLVKDELLILGLVREENYMIYSVLGNKVLSGKIHTRPISVKSLIPGTYFFQLSDNKHNTFKFIKF